MTYVYYHCNGCQFLAKVVGTWSEILDLTKFAENETYRSLYVCPLCGQHQLIGLAHKPPGGAVQDLTFEEFSNAIKGLGLPEETVTHIEPVVAMLKSCRVVDVKATEVDNRCVLSQLTLSNGITLHLAASGNGAVVYKATRGTHASSRTSECRNQQQIRGRVAAKEHGARGVPSSCVCCEVHGRVRQDSDAAGSDSGGAALPPGHCCVGESESDTEVVRRPAEGEVGAAQESPPQEGGE